MLKRIDTFRQLSLELKRKFGGKYRIRGANTYFVGILNKEKKVENFLIQVLKPKGYKIKKKIFKDERILFYSEPFDVLIYLLPEDDF